MAIANIVDIDDFIGQFSLSSNTYLEETFDSFVTQEQYDMLIDMLGAALYNVYDAASTTAEWVALRDGATYTALDGYTYNWKGLKYLMYPFIFSKYIMFNEKKAVQSGTVKPEFENAVVLTEYELKTLSYKHWNEFVTRWNECKMFLEAKNSDDNSYEDYWIHWKRKFNKGITVKSNIT